MIARSRCIHVAAGLAALATAMTGPRPGLGQDAPPSATVPEASPLSEALRVTQQTGRPTVAVATSRANPRSARTCQELLSLRKVKELGKSAQFVEMPAESCPDLIGRLNVTSYPTVLVFRRGARGPELAGREDGVQDVFDAVGYLAVLGLDREGRPKADPAVLRTNHCHPDVQPSAQAPVAAPQATVAAPAPVPVVAAPATQYVSTPSPSPIYVSTPSPSVVVQPSAPTIYVAPPQAPNIIVGTAPTTSPNVTFVQQPAPTVAASQPQQLFLATTPAPTPSVASPQSVVSAPAPTTVSAAPAMVSAVSPVSYIAAPAQVAAPSQVAATAPATLSVAAIPPGPIDRLIGGIGERLAKHKYPRVPGVATTTMTVASPAQSPVAVASPQPVAVPQQVASPPPPLASPQLSAPSGFGFFKHR